MIDTKRLYDDFYEFENDTGSIRCKIVGNTVYIISYYILFEIGMKLYELNKFVSTLEKVQKYLVENNCGPATMASMYGVRKQVELRDRMEGWEKLTPIQIDYFVDNNLYHCQWIDKVACEDLLDFIRSNFVLYDTSKESCKDILTIINKIKEVK